MRSHELMGRSVPESGQLELSASWKVEARERQRCFDLCGGVGVRLASAASLA